MLPPRLLVGFSGSSCSLRTSRCFIVYPRLQAVKRRIAATAQQQFPVVAVLSEPPLVDGQDTIGEAQRGETMRDNQHRAVAADRAHILLDGVFALVIERACRFIEDENARITH